LRKRVPRLDFFLLLLLEQRRTDALSGWAGFFLIVGLSVPMVRSKLDVRPPFLHGYGLPLGRVARAAGIDALI